MTDRDFDAIATIAQERFGLSLPQTKRPLVAARLQKRLTALSLNSFSSYIELLASEAGAGETNDLIQALTTNVTQFFREAHHFEYLTRHLIDELIDRAKSGSRVRLWSAGCSSGQEPYSIASTVLGTFPDAARYDLKILATDIDQKVIGTAKAGVYPRKEFRDLPAQNISEHFEAEEDKWTAKPELRGLISFGQLNLMNELPFRGPFDVIFCRNVTIYFDKATQSKIWKKFVSVMRPGSLLIIGHSERLTPDISPLFESCGITTYRLINKSNDSRQMQEN